MAWTQSQLTAIEAAIALGAMKVKYEDREVTYHSLAEMLRLRDMMRAELGQTTPGRRLIHAAYSKGTTP